MYISLQVNNAPHEAKLSHELIAAAASYEVLVFSGVTRSYSLTSGPSQAAKAYEKHCAENGKPASHAKAKEIMAGFAGAFVDRMVETKGVRHSSSHVILSSD